jgi:Trk-type K+ transport system membrane component
MRKHLRNRKNKKFSGRRKSKIFKRIRGKGVVTKREVIADLIFLAISAFISLIIIFLFDIHRSFYEWSIQLSFLFKTPGPYFFFGFIGTILGFFIIKMLLLGVKEEGIGRRKR